MTIGPFRNVSESNSSSYTFDIYIISRRQGTVPPTNTVTHRLERIFGIRRQHPVVQTNLKDKTPFIAARHIVYCRVGGGAPCGANLRPPPKLDVQISRIQLSQG
jgi:hypothetical protein